jgi:MFS family permease
MGRPLVAGSQLALLGREPSFRRLFLATLGSGAGTWLALVALEVDVWTRTQSSAWVAVLLIADLLPTFAIGLLVGPLIDRLSRRRLMIGADLTRFGVFAALPFATTATQVVGLAAIAGIATGFFRPAVYAGLPNLVDDADLSSANALLQTVDNLTWALGSLVGGALVAGSGVDAAYWINACTFLISAVFLWGIPGRLLQATAAASRGHWLDLKDGFALAVR